MKRNRIIAMLLGTALLVCGCQQAPEATDEEKKIEAQKGTTKTEEKSYQGKIDFLYSTDADLTYYCCCCQKTLPI